MVGQLLDKLKELGIEDNTIVMYSTDNGAEEFSWPDGGTTPFRGEKATNWEGGYRVPTAIRWPGVIKPGTVYNDVFAHEDMLPTLLAASGDPDVKQKLLTGMKVGNKTFKVHLDGYNLMPFFKGEVKEGPRNEFFYFNDDGSLVALRYNALEDRLRRAASRRLRSVAGTVRRSCACRRSSTCGPIPSRRVTRWRSTTLTGALTAPSCSCRRRNTSAPSSRRSRSSRRARKSAASVSIR